MNWQSKLVEAVFKWVQKYGWSIPTFASGMLFAIALLGGSQRVQAFSAIGTLAAAFAAFWTVIHTVGTQRQKDKQEVEERQPSLRIVEVDRPRDDIALSAPELSHYTFKFANLSKQAVYISHVYERKLVTFPDDQPQLQLIDTPNFIAPPYSPAEYHSSNQTNRFHTKEVGRYELLFYFNYAATGPLFYLLTFPIRVGKVIQESPKLKAVEFGFRNQLLEGPVEPPKGIKAVHMYIPDNEQ